MNTVTRPARLRHAISIAAATAVVSTVLIAATPTASAAAKGLSLLNFNDFHGRIMAPAGNAYGTVNFAGVIEQERKKIADAGGSSLLLSGGDSIGASLFASSMAQDQPTIDVLNALDVAASAVGNHEFDQGYSDLVNRVMNGGTNAHWPYLGANVRNKSDGSAALQEYVVKDVGGVQVGVIGVVTQETPALVSPGGVAGLDFTDPVAAVNRVAAQLTDGVAANGEAQVIVAEYHEGAPAGDDLDTQLAASPVFAHIVDDTSSKVDVIFNAHTHQRYAWVSEAGGVRRPVTQAESYGAVVARVDLSYDEASDAVTLVDSKNIVVTTTPPVADLIADFPRVAAVNEIVTSALAAADVVGSQKVAQVTGDITTALATGTWTGGVYTWPTPLPAKGDDRASESTLGGLVADSLVSVLSSSDRGGARIGVVNPGGLRAELYRGTDGVITYAEANSVLPFVNNLWTTTLTGAQFKTMLEQQWQRDANGNVPSRSYLQLGLSKNVSYTFDTTRPEGERITSISIDGAGYDPAATYRIGTFSFLAQGGDNFRIFTKGTNTKDSGLIDRDAWIDYLKANSPVTPSFARRSVAAPALGSVMGGTEATFTLGSLNLTSSGSPANTTVNVKLGAKSLGDFPVTDGSATVKVTIPLGTAAGDHQLVATASPSGTVVRIPVTVLPVDFAAAPVPTIRGHAQVNGKVSVSTGKWSPKAAFSYAWLLDGKAIPGATGRTLSLTPAMGGHQLQVQVTGASTGYVTTVRTSAAVTVAKLRFARTDRPVIIGPAKVGHRLTAWVGNWRPTPQFSYVWLANGKVIPGATKASLELTRAQLGLRITVVVTGTRLGYETVTRASWATEPVRR